MELSEETFVDMHGYSAVGETYGTSRSTSAEEGLWWDSGAYIRTISALHEIVCHWVIPHFPLEPAKYHY